MAWLLAEETARTLQRAERAGLVPSADQLRALQERVEARSGAARLIQAAGSEAEIRVEGILTKRPDPWLEFLGEANTAYTDIAAALAAADADPTIKSLVVVIDSPGGHVDGLFDAIGALQAFTKPKKTRAVNAQSAAYALAASAGPIEAAGPASNFGSVGTAMDIVLWTGLERISLTNTDSPDKRPDLKTEEGRAVIVRYLDAVNDLFVEAIATGRGVSKDVVTKNFGRGATLLANEALERRMIDEVAGKANLRVVRAPVSASDAEKEISDMDIKTLKAQHPQLAEELTREGVAQERDRVVAHLMFGEKSGAMDVSVKAIKSGEGMTLTLQAEYMTAALNQRDTKSRQQESDAAGQALGGATSDKAEQQDVGDAAAAIMAARRGKKLVAHG